MRRIIITMLFLSLFLCGCQHQFPFSQPSNHIIQIELIDTEDDVHHLLTGEDISQFINNLTEIQCYKNLQPIEDIGHLQILIYYENGDIDIVGCKSNGTIKDGKRSISGWFYFNETDLEELFISYSNQLPYN